MKIKSEKSLSLIILIEVIVVVCLIAYVNFFSENTYFQEVVLAFSAVAAVLALMAFYLYKTKILDPIKKINQQVKALSSGEEVEMIYDSENGLIESVGDQIKDIYENVHSATNFAIEIGDGNFDSEVGHHQEGDALTSALLEMRKKLREVADEEAKRNWAVQGLATFSELLRNNQDNLEELGYNVIKNLVKYLGANQGGFFSYQAYEGTESLTEDERLFKGTLSLVSCYAYEKRKYKVKEVMVGEGLVGQCVIERETIFLTDVPDDYINITSGLGKATPKSVLIVPLKVNEDIFGVLEIAGFIPFQPHQVKFVEDLSESIASTLSSVRMAMHTQALLQKAEDSNKEMFTKERQMNEIQDELAGKLKQIEEDSVQFQSVVEAINKTNASIEFDMQGNIIGVNDMFLSVMGYKKSELIGRPETYLLPEDEKDSPQHSMMWESLKTGQYFSGEFRRINKVGKSIWMNGTYNPIFNIENKPYKIIKFASFTTDEKERELDLNGKLNALKDSVGVLEIDMEGKLRSVNSIVLDALGYRRLETRNKPFSLFLGDEKVKSRSYKNLWDDLKDGDSSTQVLTFFKKEGGEVHYKASFSPIKNILGESVKVLVVLVDVTKEILQEKKLRGELEEALNNSKMIKLADEEKDTEGALFALNDALEELNKGDLSVESIIEKNSLPILMFDRSTLEVTGSTQLMEVLFGFPKGALIGKKMINEVIEFPSPDAQKTFEEGVMNFNVFQEGLLIRTAEGDLQKMNTLFAPILGAEGTSVFCMITIA